MQGRLEDCRPLLPSHDALQTERQPVICRDPEWIAGLCFEELEAKETQCFSLFLSGIRMTSGK